VLGSLERFLGILVEEYAGAFPAWLAPVQVVVMNITDAHASYVREVAEKLKIQGVRAESDLRNEKIGLKIRERTLQRVPYMLIAGSREVEERSVAVRTRGGQDLGVMSLEQFAARLHAEIANRSRGY